MFSVSPLYHKNKLEFVFTCPGQRHKNHFYLQNTFILSHYLFVFVIIAILIESSLFNNLEYNYGDVLIGKNLAKCFREGGDDVTPHT